MLIHETMTSLINIPGNKPDLESFGCKLTIGGAHTSRTMMLEEITMLVSSLPNSSSLDNYRQAVIDHNILGKGTLTTREKTFRYLRELYALTDRVPLFAVYRDLFLFDPLSTPLLTLLVAWSRDPLLRATTPAVLSTSKGTDVLKEDLEKMIMQQMPNQYSPLNTAKIARNAASSWTQSGHLLGRTKKTRSIVESRSAALTMALLLGRISGLEGERLFITPWCRLLDLNAVQARSLAALAHREGLINLRAIGSIVEVGFPRYKYLLGEKHESGQQTDR